MIRSVEQAERVRQSSQPLVSVAMPAYNAERFLAQAIESVLGQSYPHLELLVIDDASSDQTSSIAERYAARDPRVRVLRNQHNLHVPKTRNRGFAELDPSAKYVAIMDSDDVCLPDRIERQVAFLESHPSCALVGGHTIIIDEQGREIGRRRYPVTHQQIARVITRYNPIAQPTAMIRKAALDAVGVYDETFPRCEDYELWMRIAARFELANLDAFTLKYRISTTQSKQLHMRDMIKSTLAIQRRWLFHPSFFRPFNLLYYGAEHGLLLLPEPLVLKLFKRITYQQERAAPAD
jgi:glycosyltransferase involved in cell wall biosynthesis